MEKPERSSSSFDPSQAVSRTRTFTPHSIQLLLITQTYLKCHTTVERKTFRSPCGARLLCLYERSQRKRNVRRHFPHVSMQ
jgi:hypothetical protein